jgi:hypothetical protein
MKIYNNRGTDSYPKVKHKSNVLVWQATQFRKEAALKAFQTARMIRFQKEPANVYSKMIETQGSAMGDSTGSGLG